jgi:hypothetical protein
MPDIIYNRPAGRKKYISIAKHQINANNSHSKWISINVERDLFDYSDFGNFQKLEDSNLSWTCEAGQMWSLKSDRSDVGTEKQQFGFFQRPVNEDDYWHGFPIIPYSKSRYNLSETLLERWVNEGVIREDDVPNIIKKRRI